ncbi:uncharacterized protein MONBRDRAFT_34235 [Monosiga brevicollis MX1]|uniref:Coiled-coil domain-containing protein 47 n=1 Tax=Monosiga brevicollis TaxID=81824 RepID=A9VAE2_MONBE|nr:uncharacterized protein MONBRDRAFT_34235 [Monosiga brevicollis MX1]EDQ85469.1 predicted protein [Monosiga brevicollis MX1]|eukprot:XP_001749660.1 hypothetical protein [Monosiga brevicollis MX1]
MMQGRNAMFLGLALGLLLLGSWSGVRADADVADDEFDVAQATPESQPAAPIPQPQAAPTPPAPAEPAAPITSFPVLVQKFPLEVTLVALLLIYMVNYVYGTMVNKKIATRIAERNIVAMREAFGAVGDQGDELICESNNEYVLYGTGRTDVVRCNISIDLLRRQDAIGYLIELFTHVEDAINVTVDLRCPEPAPLVLTVGTPAALRRMAEHEDSKFFTSMVDIRGVPSGLDVLTESPELGAAFLTKELLDAIQSLKPMINAIHVSDQWYGVKMLEPPSFDSNTAPEDAVMPEARQVISLSLKLPYDDANLESKLVPFILQLTERVRTFACTGAMAAKADKRRSKFKEAYRKAINTYKTQKQHLDGQDRRVKQKLEAQKQGEAAFAKFEEKQKKRMQRKQAKKGMVKMVM